ncbi:MAG: DUF1932 domain-containing protein [Clostridia bacterium]|nr:DUF1932 domain-containing protein [Clostridia bacterium]
MVQKSLGFIGLGEAAFNMAKGLKKEGFPVIFAYDKFWNIEPQAALIKKRADEAGVVLAPTLEEMLKHSGFIMSAVSANLALPLAEAAAPYLTAGQIYIDLNAASPMTKEKVSATVHSAGAFFTDAAVMGPVPNYGHKVPILACGNGAQIFHDIFKPYGMDITYIGEKAGSASALKMFRSIFMKGFVMLLVESALAGHRYGVEDEVMASIVETLESEESVAALINGLMCRGVVHSERREHEMDEVIATMQELQMDSIMSKAAKEKLRWCTNQGFREFFGGLPPEDFHDVLTAFDKIIAQKEQAG